VTAQPVEPLPQLEDDEIAEQSAAISAAVIERLRREGKPVPGIDPSP
jgi:hypothetical protein